MMRALLIGLKNCEAATGLPWRRVLTHYRPLAIGIGRKRVIPAEALLDALRRDGALEGGTGTVEPIGPAERIRAMLGKGGDERPGFGA